MCVIAFLQLQCQRKTPFFSARDTALRVRPERKTEAGCKNSTRFHAVDLSDAECAFAVQAPTAVPL